MGIVWAHTMYGRYRVYSVNGIYVHVYCELSGLLNVERENGGIIQLIWTRSVSQS